MMELVTTWLATKSNKKNAGAILHRRLDFSLGERSNRILPFLYFLTLGKPGVEDIAQAITEQVERQDCVTDRQAREDSK